MKTEKADGSWKNWVIGVLFFIVFVALFWKPGILMSPDETDEDEMLFAGIGVISAEYSNCLTRLDELQEALDRLLSDHYNTFAVDAEDTEELLFPLIIIESTNRYLAQSDACRVIFERDKQKQDQFLLDRYGDKILV